MIALDTLEISFKYYNSNFLLPLKRATNCKFPGILSMYDVYTGCLVNNDKSEFEMIIDDYEIFIYNKQILLAKYSVGILINYFLENSPCHVFDPPEIFSEMNYLKTSPIHNGTAPIHNGLKIYFKDYD